MKTLPFWVLVHLLALPSLADETPADKAPAPAAEARDAGRNPVATAFLGVGTTAIPEILLNHLDLKPEEGIMIDSIQEDGPATKAGIKAGDIIVRFAGKPVGSTPELGARIRDCKPGDKVRVEVIHKGKPAAFDVTLAERPANLIDPAVLDILENPAVEDLQKRADDLQRRVQGLQLQMRNLAPGNPMMLGGGININGGGELRLRDNEGSVGYKTDGEGTEITVRDLNDKVVWSGPWDTDQDKAAAPPEIRTRIERFNIRPNGMGNGIQLRMGGDNGFQPQQDDGDPADPKADGGGDEEEP